MFNKKQQKTLMLTNYRDWNENIDNYFENIDKISQKYRQSFSQI